MTYLVISDKSQVTVEHLQEIIVVNLVFWKREDKRSYLYIVRLLFDNSFFLLFFWSVRNEVFFTWYRPFVFIVFIGNILFFSRSFAHY